MAAKKTSKKKASKRVRPKRLMLGVDLFVESRREKYDRATKLAGLREVSEWVRRVLDDAADKLIAQEESGEH